MSHKVTIEINTGNAAFGDDEADEAAEVVRILKQAAEVLDGTGLLYLGELVLRDSNGNPVGLVRVARP